MLRINNKPKKSRLPLNAEKLLGTMVKSSEQEDVIGDMEEIYRDLAGRYSRLGAWIRCWAYIMDYFPRFLKRSIYWSLIMLSNYIKTAFRTIVRQKIHSFINIGGLALGIAVFALIMTYVRHELSYDSFHDRADDIYMIAMGDDLQTIAPLGYELKKNFPEIEHMVRLDFNYGGGRNAFIRYNNNSDIRTVEIKDFVFADDVFFRMFSFPVISGSPETALSERNSLVLTRSTAVKIFGSENAVGETVSYVSKSPEHRVDLTVTAVVDDVPGNSSIFFNGMISFSTLEKLWENVNEDWRNWGYSTFVTLKESVFPAVFEQKASAFFLQRAVDIRGIDPKSNEADDYRLNLVSLRTAAFFNNNKMQYMYIISAIAFIIIVIAVINFINLSTARSAMRAKEIGIRKVVGSDRKSLIRQYIFESVLYAVLASVSAVFIIGLLKPHFFEILGISVSLDYFLDPYAVILFFTGTVITGIAAGIYPALYLSSFEPVQVLKSEITKGEKGKKFRQLLTIFQFAATIVLFICTMIISRQMDYINTKDTGVKSKYILYCKPSQKIWDHIDVLREKLVQSPEITGVAASSGQSGLRYNMGATSIIDGREHNFRMLAVDPYYAGTVGIDLLQGRNFSNELATDKYTTLIINETAAKEFGFENPVGAEIDVFDGKRKIIGVMKDYHNRSFHHKVGPSALWYLPHYYRLNISILGNNIQETLKYIEKTYNEISPELPFAYTFVDEAHAKFYRQEERARTVTGYFSVFAMFIACLGLFGLMSFTAQRRTKEIGIRKVNGASTGNILLLLSKDCVRWILLANAVAWPLAWYAMNRWLENFAYRIDINLSVFAQAGFAVLAVALLTVSFQAVKAACANPIDALKNE